MISYRTVTVFLEMLNLTAIVTRLWFPRHFAIPTIWNSYCTETFNAVSHNALIVSGLKQSSQSTANSWRALANNTDYRYAPVTLKIRHLRVKYYRTHNQLYFLSLFSWANWINKTSLARSRLIYIIIIMLNIIVK